MVANNGIEIPREAQELIELYYAHRRRIAIRNLANKSRAKRAICNNLKRTTINILKYLAYVESEKKNHEYLNDFDPITYAKNELNKTISQTISSRELSGHWRTLDKKRKEYQEEARVYNQTSEPAYARLSQVVSIERLNEVNAELVALRGGQPNIKEQLESKGSTISSPHHTNRFEHLQQIAKREFETNSSI